jgi:hypothetical protein
MNFLKNWLNNFNKFLLFKVVIIMVSVELDQKDILNVVAMMDLMELTALYLWKKIAKMVKTMTKVRQFCYLLKNRILFI